MAQGRKTRPITPTDETVEQLFTLFAKLQRAGFAPTTKLVNTDRNPFEGTDIRPFGFSQVDRPEISMYLPALKELGGWMPSEDMMEESKKALLHETAHQETRNRRSGSGGLALDPIYTALANPKDAGHDALFLAVQDEIRKSQGKETYVDERKREKTEAQRKRKARRKDQLIQMRSQKAR